MNPELLESWRVKAKACRERIESEGYYPAQWKHVKDKTKTPDDATDMEELLRPFQAMWELLPDSRAIRFGPFFEICDLAEEYCFGDWRQAMETTDDTP